MLISPRAFTGVVAFATLLLFSSCKKDSTPTPTPASTSLKIIFSDAAGNKVSGAIVNLYASQTDWIAESSPTATAATDGNGQVTFSGLASARYWWLGKKDCLNNSNSYTSTAAAIPANQTSVINTTMQSTGTLKFVNTSSNPYRVYVNGTIFGDQAGGTTVSYKYEVAGNYTLRVVQQSGYVVTPTDRTYTGTLVCNGTLTTTYP